MTIEPSQNRLSSCASCLFVRYCKCRSQYAYCFCDFFQLWTRPFFGGHLAEVKLVEHTLPNFQILNFCQILTKVVEADISLLFFRPVTVVAVLLEEWVQLVQRFIRTGK